MLRFIASRILQAIPVLFVIITMTFFMLRFVPGGPFTAEKAVTPEVLRNLEAHYGLDKPLYQQYFDYLGQLLRGDLGPSFKYPNRTVNEIIAQKLPVSLELGALSLLSPTSPPQCTAIFPFWIIRRALPPGEIFPGDRGVGARSTVPCHKSRPFRWNSAPRSSAMSFRIVRPGSAGFKAIP